MNVFILTEGGKNVGLGHIARCTAIYQAFEEYEVEPKLIINGDETIHDFVSDKNCRIFDWLNDREAVLAALKDADIAFVDSYLAGYDLYESISKAVKTPVYFDDVIRMNYPRGFVVNGTIFAERMPYLKRDGVRYLLGTQYTPLRREFWDLPGGRTIRNNLWAVMIVLGGSDICNLTPKVLKLLVDAYPELVKKVIIGLGFQNTAEIEALKDRNTELVYYPDAAGIKEVMLESDVAISAGGQTLYELARVGLPTIAVATADNQLNNIRNWEEAGFIEYAGEWEDPGLIEAVKQKIELLRSKSIREDKSRISNEFVDGGGSIRIVKRLLSGVYGKKLVLRRATFEDARRIFNLANDDAVRKGSFKSDKIEWEHHIQWLKNKLADTNCLFLIVECSAKFAGQVRFDVNSEGREAVINISLKKNMRGLGLSPLVIKQSIERLMEICKEVKLIKAYVKDENIASIKAFEKADFKFLEITMINNCKAGIYEKVVGEKRR